MPALAEDSRGHQAITSVVPFAADDQDPLSRLDEALRLAGECDPRRLHQFDRGHTLLLDRPAIVLAHLRGVQTRIQPICGHSDQPRTKATQRVADETRASATAPAISLEWVREIDISSPLESAKADARPLSST